MTTGLAFDPAFLGHDPGPGHPECPGRLLAVVERLAADGLMPSLEAIRPQPASFESVCAVHDSGYVAHLRAVSAAGGTFQEDDETVGGAGTWQAACLAAGAVQSAVDAVLSGRLRNAFCAVRPPGHHARPDGAGGFCFLNNVAIGARYAQRERGVRRVAIVDWDAHHGNGTQDVFARDATVFYASAHQYPSFPGTGRRDETGTDAGAGFTLNVPLGRGASEREVVAAFRETVCPAVSAFGPDLVLISAGFDMHARDPLGQMLMTESGFAELTRMVMAVAAARCAGRLVSVLEGGYDPGSLAASVAAHVRELTYG